MTKKQYIGLFLSLSVFVFSSCKGIKYYNYEVDNHVYTELQLKSNGTFDEYIYFGVGDSIIQDDFGNLISGIYSYKGDTLVLTYIKVVESNSINESMIEVYLKNNEDLVKLEPITYSHHFLNMVYLVGKSSRLRELPNYNSIKWKKGL